MNKEMGGSEPLIRVEHLKKYFDVSGQGKLHAVDDVTLDIMPKETLGLVGESGCGKSTIGNVIMQLLSKTSGHVYYEGQDIFSLKKAEKQMLRQKMQMIFQDPFSSLNPRKTIRSILMEAYRIHGLMKQGDMNEKIERLVEKVGLELFLLDKFPHELDGGRRQLVGIARALSLNPKFIVCDEPVSSLDVSVQATIINLLIDMQKEMGLTYLFVSHDLSVVRHISQRVAVMYLGQIIELAETDELFENPRHPYTVALMSAIPQIEYEGKSKKRIVLTGDVPSPMNPQPGCRFASRCWMSCKDCASAETALREIADGHFVACPYWEEVAERAEKRMNG